jgi:hypothetical protein
MSKQIQAEGVVGTQILVRLHQIFNEIITKLRSSLPMQNITGVGYRCSNLNVHINSCCVDKGISDDHLANVVG